MHVKLSGVLARCVSETACAFSMDSDSTPVAESVSPDTGSHANATVISIMLSGNVGSSGGSDARVWLGETECPLGSSTPIGMMVHLNVPMCAFAASTVSVTVLIPGLGYALNAAPDGFSMFTVAQELIVSSMSPTTGSHFGGTRVTLLGSGFGGGALHYHPPVDDAHGGSAADMPSMTDSELNVGGLPCVVESETHSRIVCLTSAVPLFKLLRAPGPQPGSGCSWKGNGASDSFEACTASCANHGSCNTVSFRNYTRSCRMSFCSVCTAESCGYQAGDVWQSYTSSSLPQPAFAATVSVHANLMPVAMESCTATSDELFSYNGASSGPQLTADVIISAGIGAVPTWDVLVLGTGLGDGIDGSIVAFGNAPTPADNILCEASSWSGTNVTCSLPMRTLPGGTWDVRVWVAAANGWSSGKRVVILPAVEAVEASGLSLSTGDNGTLASGHGGGIELTLRGTGLGLSASDTSVTVCGMPCLTVASNGTSATCLSPRYPTSELADLYPLAFASEDLATYASYFGTNRPYDRSEGEWARAAFTQNIDAPIQLLTDGGDWRSEWAACTFEMRLPPGSKARISGARVFPPTDPARRLKMVSAVLEVRNLTFGAGSGEWVVVASLANAQMTGMSVMQGWSSFAVDDVIAQAMRIRLPASACSSRGDLLRGVRFDGVLLAEDESGTCPIVLGQVEHPLAAAGSLPFEFDVSVAYSLARTPTLSSLSLMRGGARGGTSVTLSGERMEPVDVDGASLTGAEATEGVRATLAGYECESLTSIASTEIVCVTAERTDGIRAKGAGVWVEGKGDALLLSPLETEFMYIDLWSDPRSWLNSEMPADGDSVVVPLDQAIMLDVDSPKLFLLLVQGVLEFDRKDLMLNSTYIWIAGGHLQVGTAAEPFMQKATITLHGDRWNTIELPFIGCKMLAVTNLGGIDGAAPGRFYQVGQLDLHGIPRHSWTRIVETAESGTDTLKLADPIDWPVGAEVLITQSIASDDEEIRRVLAVQDGGMTLVLDAPLSVQHLGIWHWHEEGAHPTDLRAAVALLERNVKVQGDDASLQRGSAYMFGAHTGAFHGGVMRISNTEFTRSGQAANLGRYTFHWHHLSMAGRTVDVADGAGYIKNCSIHHTFQRAVVVHGTDYATVKDNVAYRAMGHNFFTEEGQEKYALFEHNLAVASVPHPLLLGDDSTPAGFWLPGFTGWHRHNLAVGCANGWKLNRQAGAGAAQTDLTFFNNSAHACGFGWRLFPPHQPPTPNIFQSFTAFRCDVCMFYYSSGNINHLDHRFVECGRAVHLNHYMNSLHAAPFFTDLVLIGNIDPTATHANAGTPAVHSPKDNENWLVVGMHVSNYFDSAVLHGCFENACTMRYEGIVWKNSYQRTYSKPGFSGIFHDLDGSLTGFVNGWVTWDEPINHWADGVCDWTDSRFVNGIVCGASNGSVRMRRLWVNGQEPWQLDGKNIRVNSAAGTSLIGFDWKKLYGWAVPVIAGRVYDVKVDDPNDWQQLKLAYSVRPYVFEEHGWAEGAPYGWANATRVAVVDEMLTTHLNYTDFRHHFDASVGGPSLTREPDMFQDDYGNYAQKLWGELCAPYQNLSASTLRECSGDYTNVTSLETRTELNQQPELPWVKGRLTTIVTPRAAPGELAQTLFARECPAEGCPVPERVKATPTGMRRWSDASLWSCVKMSAGASIRQCSPIPDVVVPPTTRRQLSPRDKIESSNNSRRQLRASAARVLPHGLLRAARGHSALSSKHGASGRGAARRLAEDVELRLPQAGDDVLLGPRDHVLLDVETPPLNWLTIEGALTADVAVDTRITARSVLVWGALKFGTEDEPIPANRSAVISLYGEPDDHTVLMTEGQFLVNKVLAVLGSLSMAGKVNDAPVYTKLKSTCVPGDLIITVRGDMSGWAADSLIAIGPTEYPLPPVTTELETISLAGAPLYNASSDTTELSLAQPLQFRHFAGMVLGPQDGGHWPSLELAATVALVGGRSNVRIETLEPLSEYGGVVTIGGSLDGLWVGAANLTDVEFVRMGKFQYEHPALHFNYLGDSRSVEAQMDRPSKVERCVFSQSQAGAVQVDGASALSVISNVFHQTYRTALWIGGGSAHDAIEVVGNVALETLRHPRSTITWVEPFAAFLLEVRPLRLEGNIAAGSADSGFVLRPMLATCVKGDDGTVPMGVANEAVGCLTGFFILKGCQDAGQCNVCAQLRGALAWKNAHAGVITVDQNANTRLSEIAVADNHIGITLNFKRSFGDVLHRTYYHNITVFGSTAASTCASSTTCRAIGQFGVDVAATVGASCNSVLGPAVRRVGVLVHMVNAMGKLCESSSMLSVCRPPNRPIKQCVMPWEHRLGTVSSRYSEAYWSAVTFGNWQEVDCAQTSYAFGYNPTSVDANFPQRFSDVVWLPSAAPRARIRLDQTGGAPNNRMHDCAPGGECDGLSNMLLIDTDGSLLGAPLTSSYQGIVLPPAYGNIADATCSVPSAGYFACPSLRLRWLSWEAPGSDPGRNLGSFKAWRQVGDRSSWSRGPTMDTCPLPSEPEKIRTWSVTPGSNYNLTMFASPPKNMRLQYFDEAATSSVRLGIFLTQPFRLDVYVDGAQLGGAFDASNKRTFAGVGAPRYPALGDAHGANAFDPHERRFYLTLRGAPARLQGAGAILLRMSMVVQLSLTQTIPVADFDGDSIVYNLATLLQIPLERIKVVSVQSRAQVGASNKRRLAAALVTEAILQISEPLTAPSPALLNEGGSNNATNATEAEAEAETFSLDSLIELKALAQAVWTSSKSGDPSIWGNVSLAAFPSVSDPGAAFPPPSPPPSPPSPPPLLGAYGSSGGGAASGGLYGGDGRTQASAGASGNAAATTSLMLTKIVVPIVGVLVLAGAVAFFVYSRHKRLQRGGRVQLMSIGEPAGSVEDESHANSRGERSQRLSRKSGDLAAGGWPSSSTPAHASAKIVPVRPETRPGPVRQRSRPVLT